MSDDLVKRLIDARQDDCGNELLCQEAAAHIKSLTALRNAAIAALIEAATARGQAEGKPAASEMVGVVDGWQRRCEALEKEVERLRMTKKSPAPE